MRCIPPTFAGLIVASLSGLLMAPAAQAVPTTMPADQGKVLVLPFSALNKSEYEQWLGRSVQQSLLADLTAVAPGQAVSADAQAPDEAGALEAGRKAGAAYVVYGTFATSNHELRLTGQLVDVSTGKSIAGLKATGPAEDVFRLEDQIARQVRQRLGLGPPIPQNPGPGAESEPTTGPLRIYPQPSGDEYYQTYGTPSGGNSYYNNYYYSNPYPTYDWWPGYDWGWWPWWDGFVIANGRGFHNRHRDFDRDFDGNREGRGAFGAGVNTLHGGVDTLHGGVDTLHGGVNTLHGGFGTNFGRMGMMRGGVGRFHGGIGARGGFGGGMRSSFGARGGAAGHR